MECIQLSIREWAKQVTDFFKRFLGTTQTLHFSATHLADGWSYIHNLATWVDPRCKWLPSCVGYWECLRVALRLLLLSKGGLWQWDRQPPAAAPWRGACKPPFCEYYHKKLVGFLLSNIDWHNHICILRNTSLLCVAINFDAAIIQEYSCLFCGTVLGNTLQGSAVFIAIALWISTSKYFLMYFTWTFCCHW